MPFLAGLPVDGIHDVPESLVIDLIDSFNIHLHQLRGRQICFTKSWTFLIGLLTFSPCTIFQQKCITAQQRPIYNKKYGSRNEYYIDEMKSHLRCHFMISSKVNYRKHTLVHPAPAAVTYQWSIVYVCFTHLHHLLFCFTQQQNLHQQEDHAFLNQAKAGLEYPEDTHTHM